MTRIVVLGWDALDIELADKYGLHNVFGPNRKRIETFSNPIVDEPHTRELWPSMITGQYPDEHGIHAVTEGGGIEWDNPVLNLASTWGSKVIPQSARTLIGRRLRERGAGLDQKQVSYYDRNNVPTVFHNDWSKAISIPNYETETDRQYQFDATRNGVWGEMLVDRDNTEGYEPQIPPTQQYEILYREVGKRLGATIAAINSGTGLVWTWFGLLDTVGHIAPMVETPLQRDAYTHAANVTQYLREQTSDETCVIAVSDHGLQGGEHTKYATLYSDCQSAIEEITSVVDIYDWVLSQEPTNASADTTTSTDTANGVKSQLKDLGYIDE